MARKFAAAGVSRRWYGDGTEIATGEGKLYLSVTDVYSRRITGWNVALRADILPVQALDMAAWHAGGDLAGLVHHADHDPNYLSVVYTSRIAELGAQQSTGSVGDSFDSTLAEAVNGLYKTEQEPTPAGYLKRRSAPRSAPRNDLSAAFHAVGGLLPVRVFDSLPMGGCHWPPLRGGCGVGDGQPDGPVAEVGHQVQPSAEGLDVSGDDLKRGDLAVLDLGYPGDTHPHGGGGLLLAQT
ncbi:MAG: DDE-type integrase/transposase/recombinase [Streptosporangiaceae bacterium]